MSDRDHLRSAYRTGLLLICQCIDIDLCGGKISEHLVISGLRLALFCVALDFDELRLHLFGDFLLFWIIEETELTGEPAFPEFAGGSEYFLLEEIELCLEVGDRLVLLCVAGVAFFQHLLEGQDQAVLLAYGLIQL